MQMFKESFTGKYDGVSPATLVPAGGVVDGLNMRKVGNGGGWKPRKGCTRFDTSNAIAASTTVYSMHQYTHPRNDDYHFIAQCNGDLYECSDAANPPDGGSNVWTNLTGSVSALSTSIPGFSTMVQEMFFYADGSRKPVMWGGDNPFCSGFICHFDIGGSGADTYVDYTREVTDDRSGTYAILSNDADDEIYVCSPEKAEAMVIDVGSTVNAESVTMTLKNWEAGAWAAVGNLSDGTASGGATLAQDGTITWDRDTSDTMRVIGGIMGYWYQITFSGALTDAVQIISCQVKFDVDEMTNKWSGVYESPAAVRFYDQSTGEYVDITGKLTNESTSQRFNIDGMTTSDYIYVKTVEPVTGIGFAIVPDYEQTAAAKFDQIDVWIGTEWTSITTGITDETLDGDSTSSFAQSGTVWFNAAAVTPKRRTFDFDSVPGFWYRLSQTGTFDNDDDDVRVFMCLVANFPEEIAAAKGVIEFKNRLFVWGDPEYPNRLRYSAAGRPDCFSGSDSGYTDAFGDMKEIKCALRFYNELIVWKEDSVWLLEGYSPQNFGVMRVADTIGLASPKTAVVVETGFPAMKTDEVLSIAIWQDTDGVYVLDGRKPKKVSLPVDHYFNPELASVIGASNIADRFAFPDPINNEYHLLLPTSELVYNYIRDEWYPPWEREVDLKCGLSLRGDDNRYYTYGGDAKGFVYRLENDTTDKTSANADKAISHFIKTRAIAAKQDLSSTYRFSFRKVWVEGKARSVATAITTTFFKDMASSGSTLSTPAAIDMENSGYSLAVDGVDTSQEGCICFQLKFALNTADLEMELWSFLFQVEARGEIGF